MVITSAALKLSAVRAFLGRIHDSMQMIKIGIENDWIVILVVFDRETTPEEVEAISEASTEVIADFPYHRIRETLIVNSIGRIAEILAVQETIFERTASVPHDNQQNYEMIDPIINRWTQAHGVKLVTMAGGRFWYTSHASECFQTTISPPNENGVTVKVSGVDTDDDAELSGSWTVSTEHLEAVLDAAADLIKLWTRRIKSAERWIRP